MTSRPSKRSTLVATSRPTSSSTVTSLRSTTTEAPSSSWSEPRPVSSRSPATTVPPSAANRRAMARPIPDAAPVTTACWPVKRSLIALSSVARANRSAWDHPCVHDPPPRARERRATRPEWGEGSGGRPVLPHVHAPRNPGGCPPQGVRLFADVRSSEMKVAAAVLAYLIGVFPVIRAVVELATIHYSDPPSYERDWGGPTLIGVLAVHCLPGVVALAVMAWSIARRGRRGAR